MADQYHDNAPIIGNVISEDIVKIAEAFGFYKDCFQNFCTTWSNTDATTLYPDTLPSDFNTFGGSSNRTGSTKILDYKKAFIL